MCVAGRDVDLNAFQYVWIAVGVLARPGEGYGMIAYTANPGVLSGVRAREVRLEAVRLPGGRVYAGPTIVTTPERIGDFLTAVRPRAA